MAAVEFQSLADAHEEPFLVIDEAFRIVTVNGAFERAYGTGRDEVIGRPCYQVGHGNPRPCYEFGEDCPLQDMQNGDAPTACSYVHRHHDAAGRLQHVRLKGYPLKATDGKVYVGEALHEFLVLGDHDDRNVRMVGHSPDFLEAVERMNIAAESDVPVLLTGETGTGKELAASLIHRQSARSDGPFVTLDCTVLNEGLFESEVFGHERGAFTGSFEQRKGLFELADGGTLFLDEIGELSPIMQAKLLRVLESGAFRRVGGRRILRADVRTICATNRDIADSINDGTFRSDLFYRIACLSVHLPSLRERNSDIPELAAAILEEINRTSLRHYELSAQALALLEKHDYPGNVRELRNILLAATAHFAGDRIEAGQIASAMNAGRKLNGHEPRTGDWISVSPSPATLHDLEAQHIARLLRDYDGSRRRTAAALGVSERTLYRKLNRYELR